MPTAHRPQPRSYRARWLTPHLTALIAVFLLAGCGSTDADSAFGDTGDRGDQSSTSEVSEEDQVLVFYQCLRDNGLDVADPVAGGGGRGGPGFDPNDPIAQAAVEQCRDEVGPITFGEGQMGENMAETSALIEFVDCIREHGFEIADPGPDGRLPMPANVDVQSQEWQAATRTCGPLLGGGGVLIGDGSGGGATVAGR